MDVYEELAAVRRSGRKAALATIVNVEGSIPSFRSAKMLVREDGSIVGTIGGGCTEAEVWQTAKDVIASETPRMLDFNLGQEAAYDEGLICGGTLKVYVEPILPMPKAVIFGGGHISKSLSKVASEAGFRTVVVDNREAYANAGRFPEADATLAVEYEEAFKQLEINPACYLIIVTRGHRDDMRVLRWASQQDVRYVGMIGSRRKTIEVVKSLLSDGVPLESLSRLHAPMGIDIDAALPEEIAVAVVAEMIYKRHNPASSWHPLSKSIFSAGVPKILQAKVEELRLAAAPSAS
jgi:xanthine dehydrogenase accessory factor